VLADLRLQELTLGGLHVRRVADDEVEGAVLGGEPRQHLQPLTLVQHHRRGVPVAVPLGPGEGLRGEVDGVHRGALQLERQGHRQAPRARPHVGDPEPLPPVLRDPLPGQVHDQLGLRPRDEGARPHLEVAAVELPPPDDVRGGLPPAAAHEAVPRQVHLAPLDGRVQAHEEPEAVHPEGVGHEQLRLQPGLAEPLALEEASSELQHLPRGAGGRRAAARAPGGRGRRAGGRRRLRVAVLRQGRFSCAARPARRASAPGPRAASGRPPPWRPSWSRTWCTWP